MDIFLWYNYKNDSVGEIKQSFKSSYYFVNSIISCKLDVPLLLFHHEKVSSILQKK